MRRGQKGSLIGWRGSLHLRSVGVHQFLYGRMNLFMAKASQNSIPYLDPNVQHVGISRLRALNVTQLAELDKTLVIQDNDKRAKGRVCATFGPRTGPEKMAYCATSLSLGDFSPEPSLGLALSEIQTQVAQNPIEGTQSYCPSALRHRLHQAQVAASTTAYPTVIGDFIATRPIGTS
jgi:hypothetical protein